MPPLFIRLASCRNLVRCCRNLGWKSVRSFACTTWSGVSDSSLDTSHPLEKHETYMAFVRLVCQWDWGMDVRSDTLLNDVINNTNWDVVTFEISDDLFEALMEERLIEAIDRNGCLKEAWDVFKQMEEAGVEPDASTYRTYICGLCSKGKTDLAFQLREVVTDVHCYGALLRGYFQNGGIDKVLDLCKEMELRAIKTDHMFVRWVMQILCGLGKLDEALYMFKHFRQQSWFFLDAASFNIAIDAACKLGKMDDVMGLLEEMKGRKFKALGSTNQ
ncbi:hypothetical protein L2E82_28289 [Cichorium intybus]|uniref:Uncharacterized protein n=1 Tax=Cichorium intybus TaxID=13427 RepID=A0ACB9CVP5_CICIN|nr:hypothetical protein L2E82_28289 [Cichorium intybus]